MERATKVALAFAAVSVVLLLLSFTGNGTGLFGLGLMGHMLWSYVLLLVGGALALWLIPQPRRREGA